MPIDYLKQERKLCIANLSSLKTDLKNCRCKRERLLIESDIEVCKQQLHDIGIEIAIRNFENRMTDCMIARTAG